ncbi:hypothetical protein DL93DRAFT_723727 [Clavulina sp. PMI_390]|nr:hypothetical protein DL93DRAFT_723727 [Clavulina sp. PMI_390]
MLADRIPHFLWANCILAVFYVRERRMVETMTTVGALSSFTSACGLSIPGYTRSRDRASTGDDLLPPPKDEAEADDRVRLAHAIYIGCQSFSQLCGAPQAYSHEGQWLALLKEASLRFQDDEVRYFLYVKSRQLRLPFYRNQ